MEEAISDAVTLAPGHVTLDAWQRIYRGATCRLSATCRDAVEAAAETVERIVARGKAVYGINTGFGKLATTRIEDAKLSELQRNLVLSHATGTGEPLPADVVGLVLGLNLTSLRRGASGVAWSTVEMLAAMLERGLHPVIPAQGSVGASGDLAPLAHLAAAMTGVGEINLDGRTLPAADALNRVGLEPLQLRPKEGLALLNGTQVSTALALAGLFEIARVFETALITGSMALDAALGSDVPFDSPPTPPQPTAVSSSTTCASVYGTPATRAGFPASSAMTASSVRDERWRASARSATRIGSTSTSTRNRRSTPAMSSASSAKSSSRSCSPMWAFSPNRAPTITAATD